MIAIEYGKKKLRVLNRSKLFSKLIILRTYTFYTKIIRQKKRNNLSQ